MSGQKDKSRHGHNADLTDDGLLIGSRQILAFGEIDDDFAVKLAKNLLLLRDENKEPATIYLNSIGGELHSAAGLFDLIRAMPYIVNIVVLGQASSAASYLLQAADYRFLSKNSVLMMHEWSCVMDATSTNIQAAYQISEHIFSNMIDEYLRRSTIARSTFLRNIKKDWYLTAPQAIEKGFADGFYPK